jgi:exopolyphosphatase/pppGpp-phosphohydrolase
VSLRTQVGAAVDVGSNSVHLLVALVGEDRAEPLLDESLQLGLGAVVDREGSLPADARKAAVSAIAGYVEQARVMGAERITLLATEPLRRAANAAALQDDVEHATGLPLHILEHVAEAELTLLGVQHGRPATEPMLVLDIGGGSTELILAGAELDPMVGALATGSSRLSAALVRHDPPTWPEIQALRAEATRLFAGMPDGRPERGVAVGGSGTNLTKLLELDRLAPLDAGSLERAVRLLAEQPAADVVASRLINLSRALQLAAGAALLEACMARYGLARMEVSDASLREGAALAAAIAGDAWPQRLADLVRP